MLVYPAATQLLRWFAAYLVVWYSQADLGGRGAHQVSDFGACGGICLVDDCDTEYRALGESKKRELKFLVYVKGPDV